MKSGVYYMTSKRKFKLFNNTKMTTHTLKLETNDFVQVYSGEKEYGLRLYDQETELYQDNDIIIVEEKESGSFFTATLTRVQYFMYFDQVFQAYDYKKFAPTAISVEDAIRMYEIIPEYSEKARELGLLVFKINKISGVACF